MELNFTEQIRIILHRQNKSVEYLAEKLGMSRQNLSQQMKRANFKEKDMTRICDALNCTLIIEVKETPDGSADG